MPASEKTGSEQSTNRLLWVDDDGPERFMYQLRLLKKNGWDVDFELDVTSAARKLRSEPYRMMLLDQMLPCRGGDRPDVWGGCFLLRWLRQNTTEGACPDLGKLPPLPANASMRVIVTSGYADPNVEEAMKSASEIDRDLRFEAKPLNRFLTTLK